MIILNVISYTLLCSLIFSGCSYLVLVTTTFLLVYHFQTVLSMLLVVSEAGFMWNAFCLTKNSTMSVYSMQAMERMFLEWLYEVKNSPGQCTSRPMHLWQLVRLKKLNRVTGASYRTDGGWCTRLVYLFETEGQLLAAYCCVGHSAGSRVLL